MISLLSMSEYAVSAKYSLRFRRQRKRIKYMRVIQAGTCDKMERKNEEKMKKKRESHESLHLDVTQAQIV